MEASTHHLRSCDTQIFQLLVEGTDPSQRSDGLLGKKQLHSKKSPKQEVNTENKDKSSSVQHSEPLVCPVSAVLPLLGQEVSPSALVWL